MSYVRRIQANVTLVLRSSDMDDVFSDMARVHLSHRPGISAGNILTLEHNDVFIPLVARGAHGNRKGEIWLDLAVREKLGCHSLNEPYEFKIHNANWGERLKWAWSATNPAYRIASQISIVSFVLGLVGLFLGLISLFK